MLPMLVYTTFNQQYILLSTEWLKRQYCMYKSVEMLEQEVVLAQECYSKVAY